MHQVPSGIAGIANVYVWQGRAIIQVFLAPEGEGGNAEGRFDLGRPFCVPERLRARKIGIMARAGSLVEFPQREDSAVDLERVPIRQLVCRLERRAFRQIVVINHHVGDFKRTVHFSDGRARRPVRRVNRCPLGVGLLDPDKFPGGAALQRGVRGHRIPSYR